MPNVYITQALPHFNFSDASKFGERRDVFPEKFPFSHEAPAQYLVTIVKSSLRDAKPGDYFVITSPNPLLFALAFAEYDRQVDGDLRLLRYDKKTCAFWVDEIELNGGC